MFLVFFIFRIFKYFLAINVIDRLILFLSLFDILSNIKGNVYIFMDDLMNSYKRRLTGNDTVKSHLIIQKT